MKTLEKVIEAFSGLSAGMSLSFSAVEPGSDLIFTHHGIYPPNGRIEIQSREELDSFMIIEKSATGIFTRSVIQLIQDYGVLLENIHFKRLEDDKGLLHLNLLVNEVVPFRITTAFTFKAFMSAIGKEASVVYKNINVGGHVLVGVNGVDELFETVAHAMSQRATDETHALLNSIMAKPA